MADEAGFGAPGEFMPTAFMLLVFTVAWGLVGFRDGSLFAGLLITPPLAAGALSAASIRLVLGRSRGGVLVVAGVGVVIFAMMFAISAVLASATAPQAMTFEPIHLVVSLLMGVVGSFLGALGLAHYVVQEQGDAFDDDVEDATDHGDEDDIDYTTEPEELVCLLTNQVVNRDHDKYVVCHNRMNVTQVCHAVYLMDYVHLLDGRCRRCYQNLRERDLQGMG